MGDLEHENLRFAAYCSHEAALLALGEARPEVALDPFSWQLGLAHFGRPLLAKVSLAIALEALETLQGHALHDRCAVALRALDSWVAAPTVEQAGRLRRLADRCGGVDPAAQLIFFAGRIPTDPVLLTTVGEILSLASELWLDYLAHALRVSLA